MGMIFCQVDITNSRFQFREVPMDSIHLCKGAAPSLNRNRRVILSLSKFTILWSNSSLSRIPDDALDCRMKYFILISILSDMFLCILIRNENVSVLISRQIHRTSQFCLDRHRMGAMIKAKQDNQRLIIIFFYLSCIAYLCERLILLIFLSG
jgi:hypothetical protein